MAIITPLKKIFNWQLASEKISQDVLPHRTAIKADYSLASSYSHWIYGRDVWSAGSKWDTIAAEADPTDYLNFKLIAGVVNGVGLNRTYPEITVNHTNLKYRDDGYGLSPANYVDFINGVFHENNIYTRIYGTNNLPAGASNGQNGCIGNFCTVDDFTLTFLETGQVDGLPLVPYCYSIYVRNGLIIGDSISDANNLFPFNITNYRNIIYSILYNTDFGNIWFQLTPSV